MNKIQSFARVIIGAMTVFFSIEVVVMGIAPIGMLLNQGRAEPFWPILLALLIFFASLAVLLYFGAFRPQRLVNLITRRVELQPETSSVHWLPAAYRLVSVFAGFYCIYGVLYVAVRQLSVYFLFSAGESGTYGGRSYALRPEEVVTTLILLALGVYLLAGAPHFVRWHLKRTVQFCQDNAAGPEAPTQKSN